jgi:hypothetical protein
MKRRHFVSSCLLAPGALAAWAQDDTASSARTGEAAPSRPAAKGNSEMPQMRQLNGAKALFVDGRPFLILGLQWDCDSCFSKENMDPLIPEAAKMGCNTAVLPLYWREVEPQEGKFDFAMLDNRIEVARRNGLRIVLVWFATWKNGCLNYAPDFVKSDQKRFRRACQANGTELRNFPCPSSRETFATDQRALQAIFGHLKAVDSVRHTVILFQMENEVGILGTDRCYCPICTKEFEDAGWSSREPERAAEAFTAHTIARYLDALSATVKSIYPLPVYANCWLAREHAVPGRDYPSGGPVERVLDVYAAAIKNIDFISPDIYVRGLDTFRAVCKGYSGKGWPLYVAEHGSGKDSRAERNVYYALGEFAAIGFSPWAIDTPFPDEYGPPLVDPLDRRWSEDAYALRDSYVPIRDAMVPLAMAQKTDRMRFFVQEEADEKESRLPFEGVVVHAEYHQRNNMARGIVLRLSKTEFVVLGSGFDARFITPEGQGIAMTRVERGRFEGNTWRLTLPVRREREDRSLPFRMVVPQVVRVSLDLA